MASVSLNMLSVPFPHSFLLETPISHMSDYLMILVCPVSHKVWFRGQQGFEFTKVSLFFCPVFSVHLDIAPFWAGYCIYLGSNTEFCLSDFLSFLKFTSIIWFIYSFLMLENCIEWEALLAVMHGWKWEPFSGNFLPPHFLGILTPVDIPSYKLGSVPCEKPYGQLTATRVVLFFQKLQFLPGVSHFPASVKFSSVAQSCPTLCDPIDCSTPGIPVYRQLPEFTQTHVHWVSGATSHLILCLPLLLLPSIFPSIRAFSNESALCIRWPKY